MAENTFIYRQMADIGEVARSTGDIRIHADSVELLPRTNLPPALKIVTKYYIASWGDRRYLVPAVIMPGVCELIAKDPTRMPCLCLVRQGDEGKPASGLPELPPPWDEELKAQLGRE